MKKYIISCAVLGAVLSNAQSGPVLKYIEDQYEYNDNNSLSGSARFTGLSGAMGALGGDASASNINPAGTGVFIRSNATVSLGIENKKLDTQFGSKDISSKDNVVSLAQMSGTFVFDDLKDENWKSIAIGINYMNTSNFDELVDIAEDNNKLDLSGNSFGGYRVLSEGYSDKLNLTAGANLKNTWYFGAGINFSSFRKDSREVYRENNANGESYNYTRVGSPYAKEGQGISLSVGAIGRVTQNLRLGLAYESPTWWTENLLTETDYFVVNGIDNIGDFYVVDRELFNSAYDAVSHQRITGSAAYVFGKKGLLSIDYSLKDYSTTNFKPKDVFSPENNYVDDVLDTSSILRIGAEAKIQNFTVRGGYRMETSPFKEAQLNFESYDYVNNVANTYTETYQPYGDLNGFSVGLGYQFNDFYLDASYDYFTRDRNLLVDGIHYDYGASIDAADVDNIDDALYLLSVDLEEQGTSTVVKDIEEKTGNFSLTLGFNF